MAAIIEITKHYLDGVGHIDQRENGFLVTFYGRRVAQAETATLQEARKELRRLADAAK